MISSLTSLVEGAFRALAGTRKGPFQPMGYGLGVDATRAGLVRQELRAAILEEFPSGTPDVFIESGDAHRPAPERELFGQKILTRLGAPEESTPGTLPETPEEDPEALEREKKLRGRLARAVSGLPDLLGRIDQKLSEREEGRLPEVPPEGPELPPQAQGYERREVKEARPRTTLASRSVPLIFFYSFEDLGPDARAVTEILSLLFARGCHAAVLADGLDTRTREGRVVARAALRLGSIRSDSAKKRSERELEERRRSLRVYGPVPYGYRREGESLLPIEDEQRVVRKMKELDQRGRRVADIVRVLNRDRFRWKDGSPFTWRRVSQILKNPLYKEGEGTSP